MQGRLIRPICSRVGLALLATLALGACSDAVSGSDEEDAAGSRPIDVDDGGLPDMPLTTPPMDSGGGPIVPGSRNLSIVGNVNPVIFYGQRAELRVRYSRADSTPIPNGTVNARLLVNNQPVPSAEGSGIEGAVNVRTDGNGEAVFSVQAGNLGTTFDVEASAEGANPVFWNVTISREGTGGLRVIVEYDWARLMAGNSGVKNVVVQLFTDQDCAALSRQPTQLNGAYLAMPSISPFTQVNNEASAGDLDDGLVFSVAAQGRNDDGDAVAFGCADQVAITGGESTTISLEISDLPLRFKGIYDVVSVLDLQSALDNSGDATLHTVGIVLDVLGRLGGGGPDGETRGQAIIDLVCEVADLGEGTCRIIRAFGARALDSLLEQYIPENVLNVLGIIGDVYRLVNELTIVGKFNFTQEYPDQMGFLVGNLHQWDVIRIVWRQGCMVNGQPANDVNQCTRDFSIDQLALCEQVCEVGPDGAVDPNCECINNNGRAAVAGTFNALVQASGELLIEEHSFTLRYGLLILGIAENWIIPAVLGANGRVSLEDMLGALLEGPCESIDEAITGNPNDGLCAQILVGGIAELLREEISRLNLEVGAFTLAGTAQIRDRNSDLTVDQLDEGVWTGRLRFGGGDPIEFDGTFEACRTGFDCDQPF